MAKNSSHSFFSRIFLSLPRVFLFEKETTLFTKALPPPCGYKFIFRKKGKGASPGFPHFIFGLKWAREFFFESLLLKVREIVVILGKIRSQNFPLSGVVRPTVLRQAFVSFLSYPVCSALPK